MSILYRAIRHLNYLAEQDRKRKMVKNYNIDPSFQLGREVYLYGDGVIVAGKGGHIGDRSTIYSGPKTIIYIGKNVAIGHNVRMYSHSRTIKGPERSGNIMIDDNVWIGVNAYIGPGVHIGNNAVIGANAVVTRDIPEDSIFAPMMSYNSKKGDKDA